MDLTPFYARVSECPARDAFTPEEDKMQAMMAAHVKKKIASLSENSSAEDAEKKRLTEQEKKAVSKDSPVSDTPKMPPMMAQMLAKMQAGDNDAPKMPPKMAEMIAKMKSSKDGSSARNPKDMPPLMAEMLGIKQPEWTGGTFQEFAEAAFMADPSRPLALYVHVPFCHHHCTFCPFYINQTRKGFSKDYSNLLLREIEITADALKNVIDKRKVSTVYFGGGTPTDLDEDDMVSVMQSLFDHFNIPKTAEFTIEGRITGFTGSKAKAWTAAGANRFSLGIQSANTALRKRLGRISSREIIETSLHDICCESGSLVIIDMLYGLPGQTREILLDDIQFISERTSIDGLDLYELRIFPGTPLDKAINIGKIPPAPSFEATAVMFAAAYDALETTGFEHFLPRHWRRNPREQSLYNRLAGSQCDMIPFGSASGGRLHNISLGGARDIDSYRAKIEAGEKPLSRIMASPLPPPATGFKQVLDTYEKKICLPPASLFPETHRAMADQLLSQWQDAGLLKPADDSLRLTSAGFFWAKKLQGLIQQFVQTPV